MRPMIVTALCLLAAGSCTHQQQPSQTPAPSTAQATQLTSRQHAAAAPTSAATMTETPIQSAPASDARASVPIADTPSPSPRSEMSNPQGTQGTAAAAEQPSPLPGDAVPVPPGESAQVARAPSPEEIALRERIQSTLATASGLSYSARRVGVTVEKSDVTLSGDVRNDRERKEVESLVQQIQGVRRVKNQLSSVSAATTRDPNTMR